jgi:hypothetical protein
MERIQAG